jgi:hypothetical protein
MNTIRTQSVTMSDASSVSTETEEEPDPTVPTTAEVTVFISDELQSIIDAAIDDGADAAIQTANEALLQANWLTPGIIQEIEAVFPSTSDIVGYEVEYYEAYQQCMQLVGGLQNIANSKSTKTTLI